MSFSEGKPGLFMELEMSALDMDSQVDLVIELIKEFGEYCIFGQQTNWHITEKLRFKIMEDETKKYLENHPDDEVDDEKIYKEVISRFMHMAVCHERFMVSRDSEKEIKRLGLLNPNIDREEALNAMYAMCRIHEDGEASYMGFDNSPGSSENAPVEFLLMTEEEAMEKIVKCNLVIAPEYRDHKSVYYLSTEYILPEKLEELGYKILSH